MDLEQDYTRFIDDLSQEELKQFSPLINNTKYMYEMAGDPDFENIVIDGMVVYNPKKFPRAACNFIILR
jgi:hypothetical protein